jgi:type IV secretory pathway TrbD component
MKIEPQQHSVAPSRDKRELWDQFLHDRELLARLRITPEEIDALEHCALLGTLTCKQDLLFILRQIREATSPITAEEIVELRPVPVYEDTFEEPVSRVRTQSFLVPSGAKTEPGSLEGIVRRRLPEQLGVSLWALALAGALMWNFAIAIYRWRDHFLSSVGAPAARSFQTPAWYTKLDHFNVLLGCEILFVGSIAAVMVLRSHTRHRRLKVRPS